jgi:hypothetical protein
MAWVEIVVPASKNRMNERPKTSLHNLLASPFPEASPHLPLIELTSNQIELMQIGVLDDRSWALDKI